MRCLQAPTHARGQILLHKVGPPAECLRDDFIDQHPESGPAVSPGGSSQHSPPVSGLLGDRCKVRLTRVGLEDIQPDLGVGVSSFFLVVMTSPDSCGYLMLHRIQTLNSSGVWILYSSSSA